MSLNIKELKVSLPVNPFGQAIKDFAHLSTQLEVLSKSAGIENNKFRTAYGEVCNALASKKRVEDVLDSAIHVRALALLDTDAKKNVCFTRRLLNRITEIVKKPSSLVIESFYQHFLLEYDRLADVEATADWLLEAKRLRGNDEPFDANILSTDGPKWLSERAIQKNIDFDHLISGMKLERYANGRYLTTAKGIYYIEQLNTIPLGQDHPLLDEVQKAAVFDSRYDSDSLLGHQVLRILIGRSIGSHITESWMNVILAIGGDPRVPSSNPRYIRWWKGIEPNLIQAVRGWLSKLDLKLFLEALEEFSYTSGNEKLLRMFPERKKFLEGLFDAGVITETRLFLSYGADRYLRKSYDEKHLPNFKVIADNDKSIIYVQMSQVHMVEGSHDCSLRIYEYLDPDNSCLAYNNSSPRFSQLTTGLYQHTKNLGYKMIPAIPHSASSGFIWQKKALSALRALGVQITPKHVLSEQDYLSFKQRYGVREWS